MSAGACPDDDRIVRFLDKRLTDVERAAVEAHIDGCAECRRLLVAVARGSHTAGPAVFDDPELTDPDRKSPFGSTVPDASGVDGAVSVGDILAGRYRLRRLLGRGGMGLVFEADDLELHIPIAIKVLVRETARGEDIIKMMQREILIGRRVSHPNVCRIHDLGWAGEVPFLTMQLLEGETLDVWFSRAEPSLDAALSILCQILDALEAAHAQGIVHRDLKPGNIMVGPDGKVTVMDFGLARDLASEPSMSGVFIGTPAYWSPEQARGRRATPRSDLYAFGLIACDLFAPAGSRLAGPPSVEHVPASLRKVIALCLRPRPDERPASAPEVKAALLAATSARPRRMRMMVASASAATLLVLAATWGLGEREGDAPTPDAMPASFIPAHEREDAAAQVTRAQAVKEAPLEREHPKSTPGVRRRARGTTVTRRARDKSSRRETAATPPEAHSSAQEGRTVATAVSSGTDARESPAQPLDDGVDERGQPRRGGDNEGAAVLRQLAFELAELEAKHKARGILPRDAPALDAALANAQRALAAADATSSRIAIDAATAALGAVRIDGPFVRAKLDRLSRRVRRGDLHGSALEEVNAIFAQVHQAYFEGAYERANLHLNRIWSRFEDYRHGTNGR